MMRWLPLSVLLSSVALPASATPALTEKPPPRLTLSLPFACGARAHINCGYGPKCSPAHRNHDHFALDMSLLPYRDQHGKALPMARGGKGEPVTAAAAGVVRYAGWAIGRWAYYGQIVLLDHDVKDDKGKRYQTLYAHLDSVSVQVGQRVQTGFEIGTLGGSSRGKRDGLGAHLHFALFRGAGGRLGSGRSIKPEPLAGRRKLRRGMVLRACQRILMGTYVKFVKLSDRSR
jgi:murein DD-endopeptidase MepM/ murein hydrolase activator NlpD